MRRDAPLTSMRKTGLDIFGYLSAVSGLGEAARNTVRSVEGAGHSFACVDVELRRAVNRQELPPDWPLVTDLSQLEHSVSLFHMNPTALRAEVLSWRRRIHLDLAAPVNAIVPFWELPVIPADWVPTTASMDVVLAPTRFVMDAVSAAMPADGPEVLHFPQAVYPPDGIVADRGRWFPHRAPGDCVFLSSFDVASDIVRKNPEAVIAAFQDAFPGRDDVALVMKANGAHREGPHQEAFRALCQKAASDARITWFTDSLEAADLWSLHDSADVLVSLHRSEGLGLGMMEAMAVGCPVIATGWSGNMDFMDDEDSIPVAFDLVPVLGASLAEYRMHEGEQHWAEPRHEAAVAAMRRLANDPDARLTLGHRGRARMDVARELHRRGEVLDRLLAIAEDRSVISEAHRRRVRRLEVDGDVLQLKRAGVGVLRGLRLKAFAERDRPPRLLG